MKQFFCGLSFLALSLSALVQADSMLSSNELQQGSLVTGYAPAGAQVFLNKRKVKVADDGLFVIGFGRDASASATLKAVLPNGEERVEPLQITPRDYKKQYVDGVPGKTVNPPEEVLARIRQETAEIKRARKAITAHTFFADTFEWPLKGPITGVFGSQRVYNGVPKRPHYGVDVAAPIGTKVMAPAAGDVVLVQADNYFSGGTLIIDHGFGVSSTMIHLSKVLVAVGDHVVAGDIIAEVGMGGRATGPHLDWRMNWLDQRVDPQLLVGPMPETQAK